MNATGPGETYRRSPNGLVQWLKQAELDFALLGRVERVIDCDPEILGSMVRIAPGEYLDLMDRLARMSRRLANAAGAATAAHNKIGDLCRSEAALKVEAAAGDAHSQAVRQSARQ